MKRITKLVAAIGGTIASLFTMACEKPVPNYYGPAPVPPTPDPVEEQVLPQANDDDYNEIYGPPSMLMGQSDEDEPIVDDVVEEEPPAEPIVREPLLPRDDGFTAAPLYGVKIAPVDDKPSAGNNKGKKDVKEDDEAMNAYREATKPKRDNTYAIYGIPPANLELK
ncbi:MAG: hypothetical protein IJU23_07740 [Proteobacteria bacterium]|nr:hypothetical protein [Pseudomonadota bacterium]